MGAERRSRVSRERGEVRGTRGKGSGAVPHGGDKITTWEITGWRRGTRKARAGTHSSLSFAMALAEMTRTKKARARGLSPLRRTSRAVRGVRRSNVKRKWQAVAPRDYSTEIPIGAFRAMMMNRTSVVFLKERFRHHNSAAREAPRRTRRNPLRIFVRLFTCRAPP